MYVVVDGSSKSPLFDDGEYFVDGNEQVGGSGVAIEEAREALPNDNVAIKG